ncbi:MAG: hypothetical protein GX222_05955 [Ruminococcaceae bacterium]|nr:hypothetical protein [Oscillospiraceae bacterium]
MCRLSKNKKEKLAALIIFVVSIILIAVGIASGDHEDVMSKAVRICMECIGIG